MKKLFLLLTTLFAACSLSGYEICSFQNLKVDGDLSDWKSIPFQRIAGERFSSDPLRYKGVADSALSLGIVWNESKQAFLLAGKIRDESLTGADKIMFAISAKPQNILHWKNLKLTIDSKMNFSVTPFHKQAKVTVPADKIKFASSDGSGYRQFEIEIPAGTIHELDPATMSSLDVKVRVTDGDRGRVYPHMMQWLELVSVQKEKSADAPTNCSLNVILPKVHAKNKVPLRIEFSGSSAIVQQKITLSGKTILPDEKFKQEGDLQVLEKELDLSTLPDGDTAYHVVLTTGKDRHNAEAAGSFLYLGNAAKTVMTETLDHLEKANIPALSQTDPFKATSYFSIVSALEWFKWGLEQKKPHAILRTAEEIKARFAAIEGGELPAEGAYSLLNLTRNPNAQLVVEYFRERGELNPYPGAIAIHFGSMNLVNASFYEYKTPEDTEKYYAKLKKNKHVRTFQLDGVTVYDEPQVVTEPDKTVLVSPVTGTLYFTKGRIVFQLPYVSRDAALKFAKIILAGKPCTPAQREAIRQDIIKVTGRTPRKLALPKEIEVFCGDNHSHCFFSDGRPTALTVTAEAIYIGLDYHILTDHGVYETALDYKANTLQKFKLNYPLGIGIEVNSRWGHVNIYPTPPGSSYKLGPTFKDVVDHAHTIPGAIIQWNHPDTGYSNLPHYLENGLEGSNLDAWEHYPPHYTKWKKEGKLPILTGGTDTHNGTFHMPERSIMFIPTADCYDIAAGVRAGKIVMMDPWNGAYTITRNMVNKSRWDSDLFFYGQDDMIQLAVDVLADPEYLVKIKKKRIAEYLKDVDIRGLINSSDAYETVK